jgi:hypothetical protein
MAFIGRAVTGDLGGLLVWGANFLRPKGRHVWHGQMTRKILIAGTF